MPRPSFTCRKRSRRPVSRLRATRRPTGSLLPAAARPSGSPRRSRARPGLPIIAIPTTYSGSEATSIFGMTDGARKVTGRDVKVLPRTIIYDPASDAWPARGSERGERHECHRPLRRELLGRRPHAGDAGAGERGDAAVQPRLCRRSSPTALIAKRARMPRCRVAIRHGAQRQQRAAAQACARARRLGPAACRGARDHSAARRRALILRLRRRRRRGWQKRSAAAIRRPALADMLKKFPIPQRLREIGFEAGKIDFVAGEIAAQRDQIAAAGVGRRCARASSDGVLI